MSETHTFAQPYFRTPAIAPDGARIAFVYAADIWLVDAEGGAAERLTAHASGHLAPCWSPDGQRLAFTSSRTGQGDIYVLPLDGGELQRVTFHDAQNTAEAWSADGQHLYFSSLRDQQGSAIYRVSTAGETPTLWVSQPYEQLTSVAVSPDGQLLAFNLTRDQWWRRGPNLYGGAEIWTVSNAAGADDFRKLSDYAGLNRWPMWAPDGQGLFFVSDRDGIENIWYQPLEGGPARKISSFSEGRVLWPSLSRDGRTLVFERDFNIWRLDLPSGEVRPLAIQVRPDTKMAPARVQTYNRDLSDLALSPDGKKVAFIARGEVFADFADKETDKERRQGPSLRVTSTHFREGDIAWSPDSRRLVYTSDRHGDEELYTYDFVSRAETRLTDSAGRKAGPAYSPDGSWLAYACSDREIRLYSPATGEDRALVTANFTYGASFAWSPDSRWLAYIAQDERLFSNLYLKQIDGGEPHQITFLSNLHIYLPLWSPNGEFLVFTTSQYRAEAQIGRVDLRPQQPQFREDEFEKLFDGEPERPARPEAPADEPPAEAPANGAAAEAPPANGAAEAPPSGASKERAAPEGKPVEVVLAGIERRLRFLTPTQMDAIAYAISPDSRDLIFSATVAGKSNLWSMPLDEPRQDQAPRQITSGNTAKWAAQFAPDGKSFYFLDGGQIAIRKFPSGDQTQLAVSADVEVDFNQEKRQIFDECWRLLRDRFYDPTFRGLDWSMARTQFTPAALGAQTIGDLRAVINLMVGELRASHMGAYPSWGTSNQQGYIGLQIDRDEQVASGYLRVAGIVPDSPAALAASSGAGIAVGDYLLAVNDTPLEPGSNLDRLLQRTVSRRVRLRVGPRPGTDGPVRDLAVRPISAGQYSYLRYRAWVYANEDYVHRVSEGRLGYVHIREMSYPAYQQFLVDLDAEAHSKQGVVIDARFNGGGHTATFILDVLARRSVLLSAFRDHPVADAGHLAGNRVLNKPTVLVINERSGSNTEMFTEGYRRLGLGKVVGRPSAGAVIWTVERTLLDGTRFRLPQMKVATPEGEDLEGTGRAVDVDVALPIGAAASGRDHQLDAAVATLLDQIDRAA